MIPKQKIPSFQKHILDWYHKNQRDLPWRKTRDPYNILISEVMSQQTQLSRVVPKYEVWMKKFPTVQDLAQSSVAEVLEYWSGLGYNRRALNLKKAAEKIVREFNGVFPQTEKELTSLPGIGKYTARAVLCFAFDEQVTVVDTNVRKVILTQFFNNSGEGGNSKILQISDAEITPLSRITDSEINEIAEQLLPKGKAYEWNQALMDYAASVLKKEKIPIPKQSKFIGSHRYYRGQILKLLLQKKSVAIEEIGSFIKKEYTHDEKEWLQKLLDELVDEGFILIENDTIELVS